MPRIVRGTRDGPALFIAAGWTDSMKPGYKKTGRNGEDEFVYMFLWNLLKAISTSNFQSPRHSESTQLQVESNNFLLASCAFRITAALPASIFDLRVVNHAARMTIAKSLFGRITWRRAHRHEGRMIYYTCAFVHSKIINRRKLTNLSLW